MAVGKVVTTGIGIAIATIDVGLPVGTSAGTGATTMTTGRGDGDIATATTTGALRAERPLNHSLAGAASCNAREAPSTVAGYASTERGLTGVPRRAQAAHAGILSAG